MNFSILKMLTLLTLIKIVLTIDFDDVICSVAPPNSNRVLFYLFSKNIEKAPITADKESIKMAPFVAGFDTLKIIIHGFDSSSEAENIVPLRKAYLNGTRDGNVLMVDYFNVTGDLSETNILSYGANYVQAAKCDLPIVAKAVAKMIEMILDLRPEIENAHIVGHSLGAQIAGEASTLYKDQTGNTIYRVTGLDPAEPLFNLKPKLTPESAEFVDVYHTQIALKGFTYPTGCVDFYVNNGVLQTGCVKDKSYKEAFECSHGSALLYFAESINNDQIMASPCDEIRNIVKYKFTLFDIDSNNNNDLSSTCLRERNSREKEVVFGEHVPYGTTGVYFVSIPEVPSTE
ncbi:lipase member H-like [Adelges cooleyi]|uniref:lipase member H-like n=1 Tax=Adelges cooleyi TaxID=133065 RepID=UPI0021800BCA|nr:lipase member H-like [Adelges cooleyi]XP_050424490.1 lipase member H-like [Adelges cooleyi]